MHGRGIAGALWSAARRLASIPGGIRAAVIAAFAIAACFGAIPRAGAGPTQYDYTGGNFTTATGPFTTAESVTGDIVLGNALPPSSDTTATIEAFGFTDGVDSISSANGGLAEGGSPLVGRSVLFNTNASGQIIAGANFGVETPVISGQVGQIGITTGGTGSGSSGSHINFSNPSDTGLAVGPGGTWSGPLAVTSPPPTSGFPTSTACVQDVSSGVRAPTLPPTGLSLSGQPTQITDDFSPTVGLAQAAKDCGVVSFDWTQQVTNTAPGTTLTHPLISLGTQTNPLAIGAIPKRIV
jgi:hypothetical protein